MQWLGLPVSSASGRYRKDFVRESVLEVMTDLCPSFDFIKNRFKPKSKLKPESSDQSEEYSKDKSKLAAILLHSWHMQKIYTVANKSKFHSYLLV